MKYFICTQKGGCRLSDLNLQLNENQVFEREDAVVQGSRAIRAALNSGWIKELTKKEYAKTQIQKEVAEEVNVSKDVGTVQG